MSDYNDFWTRDRQEKYAKTLEKYDRPFYAIVRFCSTCGQRKKVIDVDEVYSPYTGEFLYCIAIYTRCPNGHAAARYHCKMHMSPEEVLAEAEKWLADNCDLIIPSHDDLGMPDWDETEEWIRG